MAWETLVPVLDLSAGPPDSVAIESWHMALSSLIGAEVPHQRFGLWLFPERGGVVLLGPQDLAQDEVAIDPPAPRVSQDQLFQLEETLRKARYPSAIAIPVGDADRDFGLLVFGAFEAGAYGAAAARRLHRFALTLAHPLRALGRIITAPMTAAGPVKTEDLATALATVVNEAPSANELCRRLSGLLHPHIPHDRLELLTIGDGSRVVLPLSGSGGRRRWGSGSATTWSDIARLLDDFFQADTTATIDSFDAEAPGLAWPGVGGPSRTGSVLAAKLLVGGEPVGLLLLAHGSHQLYRQADEQVAKLVATVVASRVLALRLEVEAQAIKTQLQALEAPSLPILRAAEALAATAHLGEALHRFGADVAQLVPHDRIKFILRVSDNGVVELAADSIRPLADLPVLAIESLPVRAVLVGDRGWAVVNRRDSAALAVQLRVADRVTGAMVLEAAGGFATPQETAVTVQQFAAVVAPHLELLRRSSGTSRAKEAGRRV
jgi:hypothetical protein